MNVELLPLWDARFADLLTGYTQNAHKEQYVCLICGCEFQEGRIFPFEDGWYDALRTVRRHIAQTHGSVLAHLLSLDKKYTGLTDVQKTILRHFAEGISDSDISKAMGITASTVRTQRFALRERAKQAKLFLAMMELLDAEPTKGETFVPIHGTATMVDERYMMTEAEHQQILKTYFKNGLDAEMKEFPKKEKRKIAVLRHIMLRFEKGVTYSEKEVNEVLKTAYPDFVTIRRYLIEYGFLDRKADGSAYWVKG